MRGAAADGAVDQDVAVLGQFSDASLQLADRNQRGARRCVLLVLVPPAPTPHADPGGRPRQPGTRAPRPPGPAPGPPVCYGPAFDTETGEPLRIEFGLDALFLPIAGIEGSLRMGQSNLKSLLHLVKDLERVLDIESRQVWSESGANFAEVLRTALGSYNVN